MSDACDVSRSEQYTTGSEPGNNYFELFLSNNLKAVREKSGKNQSEVGDYCGVGKSTVSTWESAKRLPPAIVPKLMQLFRCSREELEGSSELALQETPPEYRTNPILKIMPKEEILEKLKHVVEGLPRATIEEEVDNLDAGEELMRELRRRQNAELERREK